MIDYIKYPFSSGARARIREHKIAKSDKKRRVWGVSYSLFDGEELLEASLESIRSEVDYINVIYQDVSWYGVKRESSLLSQLEALKDRGLIDEIELYTPNLELNPQKNERIKRQYGLKLGRKYGCNYFMTMDVDEFYDATQLRTAKEYIVANNLTHTYCGFVNYGVLPTRRKVEPSAFSVQFFCKLRRFSRIGTNRKPLALVDPTRVIKGGFLSINRHFFLQNITMHHFSIVRRDVKMKFSNSSSGEIRNVDTSNLEGGSQYVEVPNHFNIEI